MKKKNTQQDKKDLSIAVQTCKANNKLH